MTTALQIKWADGILYFIYYLGESERLGVVPGKIPKLFVGSLVINYFNFYSPKNVLMKI